VGTSDERSGADDHQPDHDDHTDDDNDEPDRNDEPVEHHHDDWPADAGITDDNHIGAAGSADADAGIAATRAGTVADPVELTGAQDVHRYTGDP
jgi:hypothetical protein